jgi:hypothetical protein
MNRKLMCAAAAAAAVLTLAVAAPADVITNLEVQYGFEDDGNFGYNSANPSASGIPYG